MITDTIVCAFIARKSWFLNLRIFVEVLNAMKLPKKIKNLEMQLLVIRKSFLAHQMNDTEKTFILTFRLLTCNSLVLSAPFSFDNNLNIT